MEDKAANIREYIRRRVSGERIWSISVSMTKDAVGVTLHTPDKPDRYLEADEKKGESIVSRIENGLKDRLGRAVTINVVQSPVAVARFIRISPRKARHVVDVVRGKPVQDALALLQFLPNSAALTVSKLIKSAMANAENNHRMDTESLEVMHVHVDEGPTLKRISPRAMGRAYRIMKRTCHITIGLAESGKQPKLAPHGKGVARTVGKTPRRGTKAEAAKPKRAEKKPVAKAAKTVKTAKTAKAPEAGKDKTTRRRESKGGE